jgi:hypothetical protein
VLFSTGGGAMMLTHSGQSMLWLATSVLPSAKVTITFITPEPEQISCVACGLTMGEAMATPNDSTKPNNTHRASAVARRRVWSKDADLEGLNMYELSPKLLFRIIFDH